MKDVVDKKYMVKTVALPANLHQFKKAIGIGLYAINLGKAEIKSMDNAAQKSKARFVLSPRAEAELSTIHSDYAQQDIFYSALVWLSEQPNHILNTKF